MVQTGAPPYGLPKPEAAAVVTPSQVSVGSPDEVTGRNCRQNLGELPRPNGHDDLYIYIYIYCVFIYTEY